MAACRSGVRFGSLCSTLSRSRIPLLTQVRTTVYEPSYQEPTVKKSELFQPLDEKDPRRFQPIKAARIQESSSLFYDATVQKFIRIMMTSGNRRRVEKVMDDVFENIKRIQVEKYHKAATQSERDAIECNPRVIFHQAVENCKPSLILTKIIKSGTAYQVPVACGDNFLQFKAMKWLITSANDRDKKIPLELKLSWEILEAFRNEGRSIRMKHELHRQCEANRAYAHFRW